MADMEHFEGPGGVVYSPASGHSKELAKWETRPRADGSVTQQMIDAARRAGVHHGSFDHQEYPKVVYKFDQTPNGILLTETHTVHSSVEESNLKSRGFRADQLEAVKVVEDANQDAAEAAANRAFHDRRMTAKAQAEADALDSKVARHLGEIPAEPLPAKKRGRPAKVKIEETA